MQYDDLCELAIERGFATDKSLEQLQREADFHDDVPTPGMALPAQQVEE